MARVRGDVREINERIVISGVESAAGERTVNAADIFLIGFPRYVGTRQQRDQVVRGRECVRARVAAVKDAEIGPGLEPEIIWQAAGESGRRVVLFAIGG